MEIILKFQRQQSNKNYELIEIVNKPWYILSIYKQDKRESDGKVYALNFQFKKDLTMMVKWCLLERMA